jgi:hypothetical protein
LIGVFCNIAGGLLIEPPGKLNLSDLGLLFIYFNIGAIGFGVLKDYTF